MRILLFTGKGGVGKTTVAAATALRTAEAGQRTLICSTDPAHSLGDVFDDASLGDEPRPITTLGRGTLLGQQLDANRQLNDSAGVIAVMIVILIIGILVDALLFGTAERKIRRRYGLVDAAAA